MTRPTLRCHQLRIIYRIVEFSGGFANALAKTIETHGAYQYCFDTLPMFLAILLFHVLHLEKVLLRTDGKFSSQKERREMQLEEIRLHEPDTPNNIVV